MVGEAVILMIEGRGSATTTVLLMLEQEKVQTLRVTFFGPGAEKVTGGGMQDEDEAGEPPWNVQAQVC